MSLRARAAPLLAAAGLVLATTCMACRSKSPQPAAKSNSSEAARAPRSSDTDSPPAGDQGRFDAALVPARPLGSEKTLADGAIEPNGAQAVGPTTCRPSTRFLLRRGPVVLVSPRPTEIRAFVNDEGTAVEEPLTSNPAAAVSPGLPSRAAGLPCAAVSAELYCADRKGTIRKSPGGAVVAQAAPGTRIAVAPSPAGNVLSYLVSRTTSEGSLLSAEVRVDRPGGQPELLSDGASGATDVAVLATPSSGLVAVTVDARSAMTIVHARLLQPSTRGLGLGPDSVVFVGGAPEAPLRASLALDREGTAHALLPTSKDLRTFGMAVIPLAPPFREDAPVNWSTYASGMFTAPVAVDGDLVARAVPLASDPKRQAVELGEIDGGFRSRGLLSEHGSIRHLALAREATGFWLHVYEATSSSITRWTCRRTAPEKP